MRINRACELSEANPEGLSEVNPEGLSEANPEGLSEANPEGLSEANPETAEFSLRQKHRCKNLALPPVPEEPLAPSLRR